MPPIQSVFFDLDGTLADTAPDLAAALNQLLQQHDRPALPLSTIRPSVSLGGNAMLELGFPEPISEERFNDLRDSFLNIYAERLHQESTLFPGIDSVLEKLEASNLQWGIVTNKSTWLSEPLIDTLQLSQRTACLVCGDTTAYRKPHPEPLNHACKLTNSKPENSVYIGDARRDIEAGRACGMHTVAAAYGYIEADDNILDWQADAIIQHPTDILDWLQL